ncbi:MAG: amidohydrolase family protein [Clostridia bacterium]|nr:amidohydrolase family protein [Clostridia bacterium]
MQKLSFFDCNAYFGPRKLCMPGSFSTKEELFANMDLYGIDRALVTHAFARELDPVEGNARLMDEIKNDETLSPMWVALPHHTGEFAKPDMLIRMMKKQNVRAVTLLASPAYYFFSLQEWNCGELYSALEDARIPLFLGYPQLDPNLDGLYTILKNHPKLPLVLTNANYRIARNLYPLLSRFDNLYVETFGFKAQDGIEDICQKFGAERLIFGSGMPDSSGGGAVAMITYADISFEEKQMIASGNLEKLLGGVKF